MEKQKRASCGSALTDVRMLHSAFDRGIERKSKHKNRHRKRAQHQSNWITRAQENSRPTPKGAKK